MPTIIELKQKRGALVKNARRILDTADAEKREMTAEETQEYENTFAEVDNLGKQIERQERQEEIERQIAASTSGLAVNQNPQDGAPTEQNPKDDGKSESERKMNAFRKYLRGGNGAITADEYRMFQPQALRALQADDPTLGGYLQAPEQFVADLLKGIDDAVVIRPSATVIPLRNAVSLGRPTLDTDMGDAEWTTELATGSEDTALRIGKRELKPNPVAKRVKVSNTLLRVSAVNVDTLVRDRLTYKFAITQEKAYMTGTGAGQPLGLFVASDDGIDTSRDVSDDMGATNITADGLINAKYALKSQYWANAKWLFHRDAIKRIRKCKDGNGQYLWTPGLTRSQGDLLLDSPILVSEYAPNTFTANQYIGIYGDFRFYHIVDCLDLLIQRLVELYAESNQTGYIGRYEGDGQPVLSEAFVRVKMGTV